jgi:hypothetical protein
LLLAEDFLISVYNLLEVGSSYRSDLVDLFGTPDGSQKGYIGTIDKSLCWDWGETGFGKIIKILYTLSGKAPTSFEEFYRSTIYRKQDIIKSLIANKIIDHNPQMLYVFKHSTQKIPAFIAEIEEISWLKNDEGKWRIWITYKPKSYMLLDPNTWREVWDRIFTKGREDPQKWCDNWELAWGNTCPLETEIEKMLQSSFSQDQFHVIPVRLLLENLKQTANPFKPEPKTCFIKSISKNEKRAKLRVPTDNQAFWGILSEIIGKTQVRGNVELRSGKNNYSITDIPANTISEDSLVFKQEIGTASTICQVMLDEFGRDYIDVEFSNGSKKNILDSVFLKRAVKVSTVASDYDKKYAETDYDYQLNLNPLAGKYPKLNVKILFDLTAGLWNKSIAKDKDEFVAQWEHNLLQIPEKNQDICVIWHYGLASDIRDGSYKGKEIGEYLISQTTMNVAKYRPALIANAKNPPKLILLPFFRDSSVKLEKELCQISSGNQGERRKSVLYCALAETIKKLKV